MRRVFSRKIPPIAAVLLACLFPLVAEEACEDPETPAVESSPEDGLALGEEDRAFLWNAEHLGAMLGEYGFKPLARAFERADRDALLRLFAEGFEGRPPENAERIALAADYARVTRLEQGEHVAQPIDAKRFVDWLMERRAEFHGTPRARISLTSMSPLERDAPDGPWVAGFRMRVAGMHAPGRPAELFLYARLELAQPTRERLERGGWLRKCSIEKLKSARAPHFLMREVASETGLDTNSLHDNWEHGPERMNLITGGVYLSDFNRDGIADMLINDFTTKDGYALYRGTTEGKLADVTRQVGLPRARPVMLVAFADLDSDGWEDLILGPGLIFRNVEGRRFVNVSPHSNLAAVSRLDLLQGQSGIAPADYDGDGRIDLYVFRSTTRPREGSWVAGKMDDEHENQLLRNLGDWKFEDVTALTGTGGGKRSVFSAVWMDADNDGRPDIYVIHEFGNGLLLVNGADGTFEEHRFAEGPADFGSMGVTCGDVDNDGGIDVYVASMYSTAGNRVIGNLRPGVYPTELTRQLQRMVAGSQLYRNQGSLSFDRLGDDYDVAQVGWAYGPAMADLDNDGWLDLHVPAGFISRTRAKPDG